MKCKTSMGTCINLGIIVYICIIFKVLIMYYLAFKHNGADPWHFGYPFYYWILRMETYCSKTEKERGSTECGNVKLEPTPSTGQVNHSTDMGDAYYDGRKSNYIPEGESSNLYYH